MIKGSIQEEDITIINIYAPNIRAPQHIRQMLTSMKGEINSSTIIVGHFNITLTPTDRSTKQKISKKTQVFLNDVVGQLEVIYIYGISPQNNEFHLFLRCTQNILQDRSHPGHKSSLGKFKNIEIISSIFSDHNAVRFDVNYRGKKTIKNTNIWRLNNMLLNNQQITEELKKEIKLCIEKMIMKTRLPQTYGIQ